MPRTKKEDYDYTKADRKAEVTRNNLPLKALVESSSKTSLRKPRRTKKQS